MATIGERFVQALAAKDPDALKALLRADLDFRALTPGRFWEGSDPSIVDDVFLGRWFEPEDRIVEVLNVETGAVGSRQRVAYRFRLQCPDGEYTVEQQAYFDLDGEQISWLRIMCSGFQPASGGA